MRRITWSLVQSGLVAGVASLVAMTSCQDGTVATEQQETEPPPKEDCPSGLLSCGGACVDVRVDPAHCGACDKACTAGAICQEAQCKEICVEGATKCGDVCAELETDPKHCGQCGIKCPPSFVCSAGACSTNCGEGLTNCGGACIDVTKSPTHCGGCNQPCKDGEVCSASQCSPVCVGGATKCGRACVDTDNDPAHCGGCNIACGKDQACVDKACTGLVCVAGSVELCYTGPAQTLGVGICKAGTKTCNDSGTGYGACVGQTLPAATESCSTPEDDNCDGTVNEACVLRSCKAVKKANPTAASGVFTIDPDDVGGPEPPTQVNCEMTRDNGGWTLGVKSWYQAGVHGNPGAVGVVSDGVAKKGKPYKLSDAFIRAMIGPTNNFDLMVDQAGFHSGYSSGNYEYLIIRDYTAEFKFDAPTAASSTPTTMQSFRIADGGLAWTGELLCGYTENCGGQNTAGINCLNVQQGPNPQGGAGCNLNMGSQSNAGWHHIFMSQCNTDTYVYVCNGAQHSSGQDMNHRWWFRERQ
jgi:hypothetical protein